MKLSKVLAVVSAVFFGLNGSARADFFDDFPQNQSATLVGGETVLLPTHFKKTEGLNIIGTVDADFAQAELVRLGLDTSMKLVKLPGNRAMVFLALLLTTEHDFGPHNDFGINFVVKPSDSLQVDDDRGPFTLVKNDVLSVEVFGDLDVSNRADREIWGIRKTFSAFNVQASEENLAVTMSDSSGSWGRIEFEKPCLAPRVPVVMKTMVYPPTLAFGPAPVFFGGKFAFLPGKHHGKVMFNPSHPIGQKYDAMDFKPLLWQFAEGVEGAYLAPL